MAFTNEQIERYLRHRFHGMVNILITAGETSEPIGNVRSITNTGIGRRGSLIADAFA